ncbi:hypothetical protein [Arthrobacter sp. lap29]|uniref:hypothetical protein n=1 Tax=Arthrobacter sp. lap29 TaxID=3056122 RepID=UPI0028F72E5F|nr:hypothetical protein [Arthrobacter sp. lap29]
MRRLPEQRMPHELMAAEPSISELAARCISAAGTAHDADPASVRMGILNMAATQLPHWFRAERRTAEATAVEQMLARDDFQEQQLWAFLADDPGRLAARNKLAELLSSSLVHDIVVGSIRQGNHAPKSGTAADFGALC